ncbi:MAG TPA: element excision factor XisH family protein [Urbifossiella sp.]|nr:element excision factor XisH family protein [Urbifossiella sp.]
MGGKARLHDLVGSLLIEDGWTITDDPLWLKAGNRDLYVDLGAERNTLAAERAGEKIAVEVQSFVGLSNVRNLQEAIGQYVMYRFLLADQRPDHRLYLSVPVEAHDGILSERLGRMVLGELSIPLLIYDPDRVEKLRWIG